MIDTDRDAARLTLITAGLLGLLGVAFGAFGAHGLEDRVTAEQLEWWQTAARYQQIHAVALLLVGWGAGAWTRWRTRAAVGFSMGIVVFSGTLYAMALGGPRILGAITPLGGLCLIAGWGLIAAHAWTSRSVFTPGDPG
jgi:uncharacterized membrane protein YgdD (TMEM256/DUF423 family)